MVDFATLDIRIDSSDVSGGVKELDRLTAAGAKAEGAVDRLESSMQGAGRSTKTASAAAAEYSQNVARVATGARTASASLNGVTAAANGNRSATGALSTQFGDFLTQVTAGANPLTAFGQQLNQVTQQMAIMGNTTKGLAGFLGGPWGAALSIAVLALGPFITSLFQAESATDELREAEKRLVDAKQSLLESRYELGKALGQNTVSYRQVKQAALEAGLAELASASAAVKASQIRLQQAVREDKVLTGLQAFGASGPAAGVGLLARGARLFGYGDTKEATKKAKADATALIDATAEVNKATAELYGAMKAPKVSGGASGGGSGSSGLSARIKELSETEKATKAATEAADAYIQSLEREIEQIGKTPDQLRLMEVARRMDAAATDEQRKKIAELSAAREKELAIQKALDFDKNILKPLRDELALLGLVGPAREEAALMLQKEATIAEKGVEYWEQLYDARMKLITANKAIDEQKKAMEAAEKAADELNRAFSDLISSLDQLGGTGRTLGNIGAIVMGLQTGDFSGVTGKVGSVLNILNQTKAGKEGFKLLADKLDGIFGGTGSFTGTMKSILQGAGLGLVAGGLFGNSKGSQLGGSIGGAIGQVAGDAIGKTVGGAIGSALGPLGSILGGLAGGLLGGLFGSTPRASATLSLGGISTTGTSGKLKAAATSAGNSVMTALADLAEQLGGELGGSISTSIGLRKGNYRVDTTGSGITKTSKGAIDFGEDAAAAVKFAIQDAIRDGVITGLREGTQALIRGAGDIETQLSKALKFENVFKELKQRVDPVGFALEQLGNELTAMKKIFAEAGASAAEYADLEKLFQLKREDAIKQANSAALDLARDRRSLEIRIMELQGNATAALAAARALELEQLDATLRPLQSIIYQMEDLRTEADKFTALALGLKEYRDTLFASDVATGNAYVNARNKFLATAGLATAGNADALGNLEGVSRDFLTQSRDNASTYSQYLRDVAAVANAVDGGIFAAETTADYAQLQLDALANSVTLLTNIDSNIAAMVPQVQNVEPLNVQGPVGNSEQTAALTEQIAAMRTDLNTLAIQGNANATTNASILRLFTRWDGDGLLIRTDEDTPIQTQVV